MKAVIYMVDYRDIARIFAKKENSDECMTYINKSLLAAQAYMNILEFYYSAPEFIRMDYVRNSFYWKPDALSEIINSYESEDVFEPYKKYISSFRSK